MEILMDTEIQFQVGNSMDYCTLAPFRIRIRRDRNNNNVSPSIHTHMTGSTAAGGGGAEAHAMQQKITTMFALNVNGGGGRGRIGSQGMESVSVRQYEDVEEEMNKWEMSGKL